MRPLPSKRGSNARLKAHRGGHLGEAVAALFLQFKLYRIVERRCKTPVGEIDLVAQRFGVTVFVEVKTRKAAGGEAQALQAVNQQRIVRAAQYYIAHHPHLAETPLRFDVIFLARWTWPRHVINAFDAS